jgi:hypothetical protein
MGFFVPVKSLPSVLSVTGMMTKMMVVVKMMVVIMPLLTSRSKHGCSHCKSGHSKH